MSDGHPLPQSERHPRSKRLRITILLAFVAALTLTDQVWVGGLTIYSDARIGSREAMNEAILHNRLPPGVTSWRAIGANGTNVRVLTVWTVEGLHRLSGLSVEKSYRLVETVALFLFLLALYLYLRHWFEPIIATLGLTYVAAILPLTLPSSLLQPPPDPAGSCKRSALAVQMKQHQGPRELRLVSDAHSKRIVKPGGQLHTGVDGGSRKRDPGGRVRGNHNVEG